MHSLRQQGSVGHHTIERLLVASIVCIVIMLCARGDLTRLSQLLVVTVRLSKSGEVATWGSFFAYRQALEAVRGGGVNFVIATAGQPLRNGSAKNAQEASTGLDGGATARNRI